MDRVRSAKKEEFNPLEFNEKVISVVKKIHRDDRVKTIERTYNNWYNKNEKHLINMYNISGLSCDFQHFCDYVFDNSEVSKNKNTIGF